MVAQVVQVNEVVDDHDVRDIQDNVKNRIVQVDWLKDRQDTGDRQDNL